MAQTTDLYLYLGRRDKTGVRFLAKFRGRPVLPTRIKELESLNLPTGWSEQLKQTIYDARMLWEPWIESSDSFEELRTALKVRGYTNIPINAQVELSQSNLENPIVNIANLPKKVTMIRKS